MMKKKKTKKSKARFLQVAKKDLACSFKAWHQRALGCDVSPNSSLPVPSEQVLEAARNFFVELHAHSCHSDGVLTPLELIQEAKRRGLSAVALTDHDTLSGVEEARRAGAKEGIAVLCGVEISAFLELPGSTARLGLHLLGYFHLNPTHNRSAAAQSLLLALEGVRRGRRQRVQAIVQALQGKGVCITTDEVLQEAGPSDAPGRRHVAQVLVRKGAASDIADAFARLLGDPFVPLGNFGSELEASFAIGLIGEAGGVSVLAHPWSVPGVSPDALMGLLKPMGLDGAEVYRGNRRMEGYLSAARGLGLLCVGGSDFHGGSRECVKGQLGSCPVPLSEIMGLLKLVEARAVTV